MSELSEKAKQKYLEYVGQHGRITLQEFSGLSLELLGEKVTYGRLRVWSSRDGWIDAARRAGLFVTDEDEELSGLLRVAHERAMALGGDDLADLTHLVRAYLSLLSELSPETILKLYENDVLGLQQHVFSVMEDCKHNAKPRDFASITRAYSALCKALPKDVVRLEDGVVDADDVLMETG